MPWQSNSTVWRLGQRFSSSRLNFWKNRLHRTKTIAALVVLADRSAFLDLPGEEASVEPAPDRAAQQRMISATVGYLKEEIPKLPDFFAVRTATIYEQAGPGRADDWKSAPADQTLKETATVRVTLRNRNGHEEQEAIRKGAPARRKDLNLTGDFGAVLRTVLGDAARGDSKVFWSRWEQGEHGREAVFHYIVRVDNPHWEVSYCCLVGGRTYLASPKYLGDLTIDPSTGAILRLTMQAQLGWIREPNLSPVQPELASAVMVEYGPVQFGGRDFICPLRSVVSVRVRTVDTVKLWGQEFDVYGPYETRLNDMAYTGYHKFGAETRILPGLSVTPDATDPQSGDASPAAPPHR